MIRLRISTNIIASLLIAGITLLGWLIRDLLHAYTLAHPAFYPAVFIGASLLCICLALVLLIESTALKRTWLARTASLANLDALRPPGMLEALSRRIPDILETLSGPLFATSYGKQLQGEWIDADLGEKASRYLMVLLLFGVAGFLIGSRIGGLLLAISLSLIAPLIPRAFVRNRAERHRNRFSEQLPFVLDGLASGMSAGLSFHRAVNYVLSELSEPSRSIFTRLAHRLALGLPIQEALGRLQDDVDEEALSLFVDGLILQRKFGGDIVGMLTETAGLLRERIELEREVRAVTTQGRLSGIIIAVLVPVSAAFLLAFNPRYIDVLFDSLIGQALVILALLLQLIGWAIISRLVRIRY